MGASFELLHFHYKVEIKVASVRLVLSRHFQVSGFFLSDCIRPLLGGKNNLTCFL